MSGRNIINSENTMIDLAELESAAPPDVSALQERMRALEEALGRAHNEAARMRDAYGFPGMQRMVELTAPVPANPMEPNVGVGNSNE
jgi:hypothetical protein